MKSHKVHFKVLPLCKYTENNGITILETKKLPKAIKSFTLKN